MSEWQKVKFLDVVQLNPRISLVKGEKYPFVEMNNAPAGARNPEKDVFQIYTGGGAKFEKGDTVIARIEPCLQNGKGFQSKYDKGFGSTEFLVFRPISDKVISYDYLYYFMGQKSIRDAMAKTMVGASGRQRVNNAFFNSISIKIPSFCSKTALFNDVPKNGSPNNVFLSDFIKSHKLDAVAFLSFNKRVFVSLNIFGNEIEYTLNQLLIN